MAKMTSNASTSHTPLKATALKPEPKRKPEPRASSRHFKTIKYKPSPDGTDSNLLILLHGLGDTAESFSSLGGTLQHTLPQTATITLQGLTRIPILPEQAYSYWDAISPLGEIVPDSQVDPRVFLSAFEKFVKEEVVERCGWDLRFVHLVGFAHGATAALEGLLYCVKRAREEKREVPVLGSIVSICGGILSFPTLTPSIQTPILHFHRVQATQLHNTLKRAFANLTTVHKPLASAQSESMPRGNEWDDIMRFWSGPARWRNRTKWELDDAGDVFVVGGH